MFRVAIVGRPNVGKSTLFNRLTGTRKAIVGDEPGITRDRIYGEVHWAGRALEVLDTGGMIPAAVETIPARILEQVVKAVAEADVLLVVVDGRAGITPPDEELLPLLRKSGRPLWVAVNKIDSSTHEPLAAPFYAFGADEVFPVSAEHNLGVADLLDALVALAGDRAGIAVDSDRSDEIAVAVVGRPNVGKSSLVNRMLGADRAIVSEIPGTTRDAVDSLLVRDGQRFRIIDTAGIRRKGRTDQRTEKISVIVARKNLEKADVALLLIDAEEGVTKLDSAIGGYAAEAGCSVIVVVNKWDKVEKDAYTLDTFRESIGRRMKYLAYAPVVSVSALTGQRVSRLFPLIVRARAARRLRIPTGVLNNLFVPEAAENWRGSGTSQPLDIQYITQAEKEPPVFVVFTGRSKPLHFSTERFLTNQLRERYDFFATPIRIEQRLKKPRSQRAQESR
jgi:GTPase